MSLSALVALALAAAPEPFKIATLQLEGSGVPAEMVETATILVPTEVRRARPDAQVMSADDVRSLLLHQKSKVVAGACGNESCMFDLGGALGADEIVAGRLGRLGDTWVLELRRVDVKKVRSLGSATRAVRSAEGLVQAVRSAAGELYAPPPGQVAAGAAGGGGGHGIEVKAAQPSDASLPKPSLVEEELEFHPIRYRGTRHRAVYDLVKRLMVEARVPIEQERLGDDSSLRLRSGWVSIERGRRLRFKVRVDGKVGFDVDREQCDDTGCAEASNTSKGERKLAGDLYGVLRAEVEKGF
jgi:hypothetical protein